MKYYAIWQGTDWAVLVHTTRSKKKAQAYIDDMAAHGIYTYMTVEQGPIVPLGKQAPDRLYDSSQLRKKGLT